MNVLCACISVDCMCPRSPQRTEARIGFPGTTVTEVFKPPCGY